MRNLFFILLLSAGAFPLTAQQIQMHDLKFSEQILREHADGTLQSSSAAYYLTYIGKYREAQDLYEVPLAWGLDALSAAEKADFAGYRSVDAYGYLTERSKNEQLVIISEAHHKPQHRVFTRQMLAAFYQNGFRYLGIEALTPNFENPEAYMMDTELQQRGYPLYGPVSGTYIREPQMSNMIREAIALGFTVFGYEAIGDQPERDLQQAQNIQRFMQAHPEGKVLIHCGWYHAIESDYPKRKTDHYMAYHLKQLTGIDPLTIYQDALTERFLDAESPYYPLIKADEVSVLVDAQGQAFNGKEGEEHFDILLYHPRVKYRKNRPDWLYHLPEHTFVKIKGEMVPDTHFPVLVKAFRAEEPSEAAPMDIIELTGPSDNTYLVLKKGKYRIEMIDKTGERYRYDLEFN